MKALLLWLSDPTNLAFLGTLVVGLLSLAANVLQQLGRFKDAARLFRAAQVIGELKQDVQQGTAVQVAMVTATEKIKARLDLEPRPFERSPLDPPKVDSGFVSRAMKSEAVAAGVEHVLAPIVTAVQADVPAAEIVRRGTDRHARPADPLTPGAVP